jgi:hypothetical protein
MRNLHLLGTAFSLALACSCGAQNTDATGKPVVAGYDSYGKVIDPNGAMNTTTFMRTMGKVDSADVKIEAEVLASCKKKGCWMDVKLADGSTMKVRFTDYAFFVPTDGLSGKTAILQGHATKEVITEAMRRHYAHDAGKSPEECEAIKGDKAELTFLADGVLIRH